MTERGTSPELAVTSVMPCAAATVLRPTLSGSGARNQGNSHAAATKRYRIAPMASTHGP